MSDETQEKQKTNKKKIIILISIIAVIIIGIIVAAVIINNQEKEKEEKKSRTPYVPSNWGGEVDLKPVIYIYPTETTKVSVKVGRPENLTHTYPKYNDKWQVIAQSNGDLTDVETGRNLYCLYWEGINTVQPTMQEGFIIKGEDTISFLEEKLEILGLTEREANEFIIYWLPKLEGNKYNYIRFQTMEQIEENMPLEITPTPDTIIRVMMEYKALEEPIEVTEQKLTTPQRNGFTVVEWGGTELQ